MQAFHNDPAIKAKYVNRVKAHQLADEIVQGYYWQNGKGCAVGCTLHSEEHELYEVELGIPRAIAYLQDRIFEGLANDQARLFPLAFLETIPVGGDLSLVLPHFMIWLLNDDEFGTIRHCTEREKIATQHIITLYQRLINGSNVSAQEWRSAAAYAYAAAAHAAAAAAYAAAAAANVYAAAAAAANAYAADAADAYAYAADAADAYAAAKRKYYRIMRDKLIFLLQQSPVPVPVPVQEGVDTL